MSTYQRWIDSGWGNTSIQGDEKMWNRRASKGLLLFHECFWWGFSELFNSNFSEWTGGSRVANPTRKWTFNLLALIPACVLKWMAAWKSRFRTRSFILCQTQIWLSFSSELIILKHHFHHFMVMLLDSSPAHGSTDTLGKLPLIQMACLRPSAKICARILRRTWSELYRQDND